VKKAVAAFLENYSSQQDCLIIISRFAAEDAKQTAFFA
jgi:hypothetical protein